VQNCNPARLPLRDPPSVATTQTDQPIRERRVALVLALLSFGLATSARAETILLASLSGNDCSGLFGKGFSNCART
jgi:hypothetical protein